MYVVRLWNRFVVSIIISLTIIINSIIIYNQNVMSTIKYCEYNKFINFQITPMPQFGFNTIIVLKNLLILIQSLQ